MKNNFFTRNKNRWIPDGGIAHKILSVSFGVLIGHVVTLVVSPLLTRLYSPTDFGHLGIYLSFVGVIGAISPLGYEKAIPAVRGREDAKFLLIVAVVSVTGVVLLSFFAEFVIWLFWPNLLLGIGKVAWLIPLGILAMGCQQATVPWVLREKMYARVAKAKASQAAGTSFAQIGVGFLGSGAVGLAGGDVIGRLLGFCSLFLGGGLLNGFRLFSNRCFKHLVIAKKHIKFPVYGVPSSILNNFAFSGITLIVASFYDAWTTGLFVFAIRIASVPSVLLGDAVAQVYLGEMSETIRNHPAYFQKQYRKSLMKLVIATGPIVLSLGISSYFLTVPIFGENWREAGYIMTALTPMIWGTLVVSPLSSSLTLIGRQDLQLYWDLCRCFALLVFCGGLAFFRYNIFWFVISYSILMFLFYLLMVFIIDRIGNNMIKQMDL